MSKKNWRRFIDQATATMLKRLSRFFSGTSLDGDCRHSSYKGRKEKATPGRDRLGFLVVESNKPLNRLELLFIGRSKKRLESSLEKLAWSSVASLRATLCAGLK